MILTWHQTQWQQLLHLKTQQRLPHALLFSGMMGIGKSEFANLFAKLMLCATSHRNELCDACHSCCLISNKTHPNVLWITPEKEGQSIKVDQIRSAIEFIQHTSLQGEYRILIIDPADKMNLNAANALLKTLEEPAKDSLIILVSDQAASLPATIVSRCQRLQFKPPAIDACLEWLDSLEIKKEMDLTLLMTLANHAPFKAKAMLEDDTLTLRKQVFEGLYQLSQQNADPIQLAESLKDIEIVLFIEWITSWTSDILQLLLQNDSIMNQDYLLQLKQVSQQYALSFIYHYLNYLLQVRAQINSVINLNKILIMEDMFVRWLTQSTCTGNLYVN